jgi:hypothetical protein
VLVTVHRAKGGGMDAHNDLVRRRVELFNTHDLADAGQIAAIDDLEHAIAPFAREAPGGPVSR